MFNNTPISCKEKYCPLLVHKPFPVFGRSLRDKLSIGTRNGIGYYIIAQQKYLLYACLQVIHYLHNSIILQLILTTRFY